MAKQHKCYSDLSKILEPKNTQLVTNMFNSNQLLIWTEKIDTKKRERIACVVCLYCPFCGNKIA